MSLRNGPRRQHDHSPEPPLPAASSGSGGAFASGSAAGVLCASARTPASFSDLLGVPHEQRILTHMLFWDKVCFVELASIVHPGVVTLKYCAWR